MLLWVLIPILTSMVASEQLDNSADNHYNRAIIRIVATHSNRAIIRIVQRATHPIHNPGAPSLLQLKSASEQLDESANNRGATHSNRATPSLLQLKSGCTGDTKSQCTGGTCVWNFVGECCYEKGGANCYNSMAYSK